MGIIPHTVLCSHPDSNHRSEDVNSKPNPTDRWTDGQMDGWTDGWMDRRMDGHLPTRSVLDGEEKPSSSEPRDTHGDHRNAWHPYFQHTQPREPEG